MVSCLPEASQELADLVNQVPARGLVGQPGGAISQRAELFAESGRGRQAQCPVFETESDPV